jgi:hypothetical protein
MRSSAERSVGSASLPTSGQQVSYVLLKEAAFGRVDNYYTFASDYGDVTSYWHGVDLTVNARTSAGLTLQGGFSTGGGVRDICEITAKRSCASGEPEPTSGSTSTTC